MRFPVANRENIAMHLVEKQMMMIGKTYEDAENDEQWYVNNTLTQEQFLKFREEALSLMKKVFKCSKSKALENFDWWNLNWGLRIHPIPENLVVFTNSSPLRKGRKK